MWVILIFALFLTIRTVIRVLSINNDLKQQHFKEKEDAIQKAQAFRTMGIGNQIKKARGSSYE